MYDEDGNGFITRDELARMLPVLMPADEPKLSDHAMRLEAVFDQMDANMDGKISLEEFKVRIRLLAWSLHIEVSSNAPVFAGRH